MRPVFPRTAPAASCPPTTQRAELSTAAFVQRASPGLTLGQVGRVSLSCGQPVRPAAIPRRFSYSSLPPSFAWGRRTTGFLPQGAARIGTARGVL